MHVHPASRDHIARRRQPIGRRSSSRRMDHTAAAGRPCELFIIGTVTTPRRCVSSPPHARPTPRIVPDDHRCDTLRSAVGAEIGGGRRSTPPRRTLPCTRRCSPRASCRVEATRPRKSAGCCPDPTRGFGARRQPRATRHAARVVRQRNRAAETNPMNDSSGDFERTRNRRLVVLRYRPAADSEPLPAAGAASRRDDCPPTHGQPVRRRRTSTRGSVAVEEPRAPRAAHRSCPTRERRTGRLSPPGSDRLAYYPMRRRIPTVNVAVAMTAPTIPAHALDFKGSQSRVRTPTLLH